MNLLLSIKNLTVTVGSKILVNQVSFDVPQGKIVAIAGGSGSGKTTVGLSILRLLASPLRITQGSIVFEGRDLLGLPDREMQNCRGARIGMVFQEPLSALDPLFTIGRQIDEVLAAHTKLSKQERYKKVLDTLTEVELPDPRRAYKSFPHQLSGGMRQRAMVAQAIVCGPSLIIADEPTSSLDITLQVKMMELFGRLKNKNMSILLIAHDLGMIAHVADEVIILRKGEMVEKGPVGKVISQPQHEYTKELIECFNGFPLSRE
jgi:ABC-type glutathione transport system ATPase component